MKLVDLFSDAHVRLKVVDLLKQWKLQELEVVVNKLEGINFIVGRTILAEINSQLFQCEKIIQLLDPIHPDEILYHNKLLEGTVRFILIWALVWLQRSGRLQKELTKYEALSMDANETDSVHAGIIQSNLIFVKGFLNLQKGAFNEAITLFYQSIALAKKLGGKSHIAVRLYWLSHAFIQKGDIDSAEKTALECLEAAEKSGYIVMKPGPLFILAIIDFKRGNLDKAKERLENSYVAKHIIFHPQISSGPLEWLGKIYHRKGDLNKAYQYYYQCLEKREDITEGGIVYLSSILFLLITLTIDMKNVNQGKIFLKMLTDLNKSYPNELVSLRHYLADAYILKQSNRLYDKMKAFEKFKDFVHKRVEDYDLSVFALLNMCDLLILEFNNSGELSILEELESYLQGLVESGYTHKHYELIVEVNLLRARICLVEGKQSKSEWYIEESIKLVKTKNIEFMMLKISEFQNSITDPPENKLKDIEIQKIISNALNIVSEKNPMNTLYEINSHLNKQYQIIYKNFLEENKVVKDTCRIGIAQIGKASGEKGDLLSEYYKEIQPGLFGFKEDKIEVLIQQTQMVIQTAKQHNINILLFPELSIDLNYEKILNLLLEEAKSNNLYIFPGSYHQKETERNIAIGIGPDGVLWEQEKHIPAKITYEGQRFLEGIKPSQYPRKTVVADTEYGRIAIVICRDFLDMDLRVELKNYEPAVDILFNLAFTPVTADFKAAHFDARRSIYAYCFFANIAEFGDSFIYSPEKDRTELFILPGKEDLIYKDINLFKLRAERKKWEENKRKEIQFIQSTK